jgi:sarcosine oxidase subunit delta
MKRLVRVSRIDPSSAPPLPAHLESPMQLFSCPFCGPRGESEFRFAGEFGSARPEGATVTDAQWSSYLHRRSNPKGRSAELWLHLTCGEVFRLDRDTLTHVVSGSYALGDCAEEVQP